MNFNVKSNLRGLETSLNAVIEELKNVPRKKQAQIARIMQDGVFNNFQELKMGGAVQTWDGDVEIWPLVRHRFTAYARARMDIGPRPMLETTQGPIFAENFQHGNITTFNGTGGAGIALAGDDASLAALTAQHHFGNQVVADFHILEKQDGESIKANIKLPKRPFVFWSSAMLEKVLILVKQTKDEGVDGNQA